MSSATAAPDMSKVDSVFRTRSLGTAASGLTDQYSDGKAAKVWQLYIGELNERTAKYRNFLVNLLKSNGCSKVLDVACGNGVDSIMLLEEGFQVTSSDASDKMLKNALKSRWDRRKEEAFDNWDIYEANWLSLEQDVPLPNGGFDSLMCMGNSFAHLPDFHGDLREIRLAIENFKKMLRPGGILIIDHRNYDFILEHGSSPMKNIYYNSKHMKDIKTSVLYVNNKPNLITLDYEMDVSEISKNDELGHFRLSYYPHRLNQFTQLLKEVFGQDAKHSVYADFRPIDEEKDPAFYIHAIEKKKD